MAALATGGCTGGAPGSDEPRAGAGTSGWPAAETGAPGAGPTPGGLSDVGAVIHQRLESDVAPDLPAMRERGVIRVVVAPSRTNYFVVEGRQRGFEYELLTAYEKHLNAGLPPGAVPTRLLFVPLPFGDLLDALESGKGDLAAAGITVTPERERRVSFSTPYLPSVDEIVVAAQGVEGLERIEDLSGRVVHVVAGSSYAESLAALNARLAEQGLAPVTVLQVAELASEDLLELVHVGALPLTVVDSHVAALWAEVLTDLVVREDLVVRSGGHLAWAVRKGSPELRASLDRFLAKHKKGTLLGNVLFERYFDDVRWIRNPVATSERAKLERMRSHFERYGERYGFDWLLLAAQGFQESGLDQRKRSAAGAVGVMQLLPTTAADPNVGIPDISTPEANIHAGAKYLAFLRDRYFDDEAIPPDERTRFALAAYNAGPARVAQLRRRAATRGLDPDRWHRNVERVALDVVGREPVRYVANVHKYYVAYRLAYDTERARAGERERLATGT